MARELYQMFISQKIMKTAFRFFFGEAFNTYYIVIWWIQS